MTIKPENGDTLCSRTGRTLLPKGFTKTSLFNNSKNNTPSTVKYSKPRLTLPNVLILEKGISQRLYADPYKKQN